MRFFARQWGGRLWFTEDVRLGPSELLHQKNRITLKGLKVFKQGGALFIA